ncbi:MAG TPA: VWA domain-containing protein [Bryobacteraceae bacterium]|nr:VWA domain-containing protein [Bryobacteraceae bacterium]
MLVLLLGISGGLLRAQQAAPADSGSVIRAETRLVLVDAVVTDKKGGYVRDLTVKDFKVWEDNKEQSIKNFSFEADPASPLNSQPRYMVLFFDNSTLDFGDQARARQAAAQFIEANAAPNRLMAIVNYGGAIQIAQNFTADAARLKAVVTGVSVPSITVNASDIPGGPRLSGMAGGFGARDVILALRTMAKNLAAVPGRKTLILLTGGFPLKDPDLISEITATIEACNRSNVAIYAIDVRGLVAPSGSLFPAPAGSASPLAAFLRPASFMPGSMAFFAPQGAHGGGSPGGGGAPRGPAPGRPIGSPGGGGGAPRGPAPGTPGRGGVGTPTRGAIGTPINPGLINNPFNQARNLLPKFPDDPSLNQDMMHVLAEGTGGFVIKNTNDLLSGFQKIASELNEYYLLGYTPPESEEGSCHTLRVKIERSGTNVRARTGYCNARPRDLLAKNPVAKQLENRAAAEQTGNIGASMLVPFFYTAPNQARVNVALEIAPGSMKFDKQKGKLHSEMDILGIAYKSDGSVGARFSDTVKLDFENKKEAEAFSEKPYHYENQFDIAPGQYRLKVVFSSGGESFGKIEKPLVVDSYDGQKFSMSAMAFSTDYRAASSMGSDLDALLIEDRTPLVTQGVQMIPTGSNRFKNTDKPAVYFELYEPLLTAAEPPKEVAVALQLQVIDVKSGEQKSDSGLYRIPVPEKKGNPAIPTGVQIPVASLTPGTYRLIMSALDSAGSKTQRWADFEVR